MGPHQMLVALDAAIAATPKRRHIAISLRVPELWGQRGRPDGLDDEGVPVYGYTRRQCERLRDVIRDAVRADATPPPRQETDDAQATGRPVLDDDARGER